MEALDLTVRPPRGPRVRLAGLVFAARAVDKLRASLPGGDLNGYFDKTGFSLTWQHLTKISLDDLRGVIAEAADEAAVERWIDERLTERAIDRERMNEKMERFSTDVMPDAWRPIFEKTYPADLRAAHSSGFGLFEADDARTYAAGAPAASAL